MIKFILIPVAVMLSCGSTKSNQSVANEDSAHITAPVDRALQDSITTTATLPTCIKNKIDSFKLKEPHEKPQRVVEYKYKGKKVYYIVMPCCDFFSEVYDENCKFLGSPDGGFTGQGDGTLPGFMKEVSGEKLIWGTAIPK